MKNILLFAMLLIPYSYADEYMITEYSLKTVKIDLESDINNEQLHFLSVCGYSCETPGIGVLDRSFCYSDYAKIKTIDPTGDVIYGDKHLNLKLNARKYAEHYNQKLAIYLNSKGKSSCPQGEKWTSAWHEANDFVTSSNHKFASIGGPMKLNEAFSITLRENHNPDELMRKICQIFSSNGINRAFSSKVYLTKRIGEEWNRELLYQFSCNGVRYEQL